MLNSFRVPVFLIAVAIILALVAIGAGMPELFGRAAQAALDWIVRVFGWLYLLSVFGFVVALVILAASKYGDTRIGPPDSTPEFSYYAWISMLLAAGFGIGLVFYGVAEPLSHFRAPPGIGVEPGSEEAARQALQYSFFNWGVSQWGAFSIVGLIVGFFQFRKGQPGLVSTVLAPITKRLPAERQVSGALDVFAVVATVIGVATSVGLGVLQINGGLNYLFNIPEAFVAQAAILGIMFLAYMVSASTGLSQGIRILSSINMGLALLLMVFVVLFGPTVTILRGTVQGIGDYLQYFISMSLSAAPYRDSQWLGQWTVFYWAWVIAWSPFVGTFVARVSRGRTIREYVIGVLIMPPLVACLWLGVFGSAALHLDLVQGANLSAAIEGGVESALFRFLEHLPFTQLVSWVGMGLIFIFLITSADSASFILAQMTDRGNPDPPRPKRLVWGTLIAAICLTLIATGGLGGLQAAVIVAALPFMFILYAMVWRLFRELAADRREVLEALYREHDSPVGASVQEAHAMSEMNGDNP